MVVVLSFKWNTFYNDLVVFDINEEEVIFVGELFFLVCNYINIL